MSRSLPLLQLMPSYRYVASAEAGPATMQQSPNSKKWSAIDNNTFLAILLDQSGQLRTYQLVKAQQLANIPAPAYIFPLYIEQSAERGRQGNFAPSAIEIFLQPLQICYFFDDHRTLDPHLAIPDNYLVSHNMLEYITSCLHYLAPGQVFRQPRFIDQLLIPQPSVDSIERRLFQGRRLIKQQLSTPHPVDKSR